MSDLIERFRAVDTAGREMLEAADELERLQARIDGLESALRSVVSFVEFEEILAEMGATKAHDKGGE